MENVTMKRQVSVRGVVLSINRFNSRIALSMPRMFVGIMIVTRIQT
jgi:hypothetical protein